MKRLLIPVTFFLFVVSFISCHKHKEENSTIYTAILKLDGGCARKYACIVTDGNIDPSLVQSNWSYQGSTYQNAFSVKNGCDFSGISLNQSFKFKIISSSQNNCNVCDLAIMGLPNKELSIQIVL